MLSFVDTVVKGRVLAARTSCLQQNRRCVRLLAHSPGGHHLVPWVLPPSPSPDVVNYLCVHLCTCTEWIRLGAGGKPHWGHLGMSILARGRSNLMSRMEAPLGSCAPAHTCAYDLGPAPWAGSPTCSVCTCAHIPMADLSLTPARSCPGSVCARPGWMWAFGSTLPPSCLRSRVRGPARQPPEPSPRAGGPGFS